MTDSEYFRVNKMIHENKYDLLKKQFQVRKRKDSWKITTWIITLLISILQKEKGKTFNANNDFIKNMV